MKTAIVIPARYASQRLPGKPLLRQTGKYLVQHVYERACQARRAGLVVVATDDPRIVAAVQSFGGRVALTRRDHPSGTDRVAEVAAVLDTDLVVNLQGDEPFIDPASLDLLFELLEADRAAEMQKGTDPADPRVQTLEKRRQALVNAFSGGDPAIEQNLKRLWTEQGDKLCAQFGYDPKVMEYLGKVAEAGQKPA